MTAVQLTCLPSAEASTILATATNPAYADVLREMAAWMGRRIYETDDFSMVHSYDGMFRYAPVGPNEL